MQLWLSTLFWEFKPHRLCDQWSSSSAPTTLSLHRGLVVGDSLKKTNQMQDFARVLVHCQSSSALSEKQCFDGDPPRYHLFMRQVQDGILNLHGCSDSGHALQLLLDSTTSKAWKLIRSCIMLPASQALDEAL